MGELQQAATEIRYGEQLLPVIRKAENSKDDAVSPAGARGRYQIMPGTARQYGFDPDKLFDPVYNERVAAHILNDLWNKFKDPEAVLVGYNAGPTVARRWLANGKKYGLPLETFKYLENGNKFLRVGGKPLPPREPDREEYVTAEREQPKGPPEGMKALSDLSAAGFTAQEIGKFKNDRSQAFIKAGFTPNEIENYWGDNDPDPTTLDNHVRQNLTAVGPDQAEKVASNPLEQFAAGMQMSVSGLAVRGGKPDMVLPEDAGTGAKVAYGAGQLIGDLPYTVGGFFGGASAGVAAAGPVGGVVGGGFGAAALPQAMREVMLDYYDRGEIHSSADFMKMAAGSVIRTGKAGLVGAIAAPLGLVAGKTVGAVAGRVGGAEIAAPGSNAFVPYSVASRTTNLFSNAADIGTQVVASTTAAAALEGKLPDLSDFPAAMVLALGYAAGAHLVGGQVKMTKGGKRVTENLKDIYRETGLAPWQVVEAAKSNRVVASEILAQDPSGRPVYPTLKLNGPTEPAPFKAPEKTEITDQPQVPETDAADRAVIKSYTDGGLYEGASNAQVADVIQRRGEKVTAPVVVYRGYGAEGEPMTEGQTVISTSDESGGKSFSLAANQGIAEEQQAGDPTPIPVARIKVMPGTMKLDPNTLGGTKPNEQETILTGGTLVKTNAPPVIKKDGNFTYAVQDYEFVPNGAGGGGKGPPPPPGGTGTTPPAGKPQGIHGSNNKLPPEVLNEIAGEFIAEPQKNSPLLDPAGAYRAWISELGPARAIDKILIEKGANRDTQMLLEDMFRQTYASDTRTAYFVEHGAIDPITFEPVKYQNPETGKMEPVRPIKAAVELVKTKGGNLRDWLNYMVAQRAIDKAKQGFETGHPLSEAQLQDLVAAGHEKYAQASGWVQQLSDAVLDYGRLSGVFSSKQVEAMRRDNPMYVSFRRIMGDDSPGIGGMPVRGRGFKVKEPVSRFEGDDRKITNPLLASIDNWNQIIRMSDRNKAIGSAITLAERNGMLEDLGLEQIAYDPAMKMSIADPGSEVFKPYDISNPNGETYAPFLAIRANRKGFDKNTFLYIRDGKPELWRAKDEALAALLRGADTPGEALLAIKLAQGVASIQRAGIVNAIDFPLRNTLRDQLSAFILDPHSPPPMLMFLRGVFDVFGGTEKYLDFLAKGGAGSALKDMDVNIVEHSVNAVFEKTGVFDKMWNLVKNPLEAGRMLLELMQNFSGKIDQASRLGYMKGLEAKGIDSIKAATLGRKAMLDFVERGTSNFVQGWARVTPFLRPTLLGYKQFGEAVVERPGSTLLKTLAAVTVPTMVLYALNWLQDKYQDIPEAEKFKNLPRYYKDGMYILPQVGGVRLRLPYPPVIGTVFGGLVTRFLDKFANDDPEAFEKWSHALLAQVIPPFVPSIVAPVAEWVANKNFYTGHPLIPSSLEGNSGPMQATENTTEVAQRLAKIIHPIGVEISPIVAENFVRDWTGSLGMTAMKALDVPFKAEGKPWEMSDIPFVGSFFIRNPGTNAQPIQDFFDHLKEYRKTEADRALALKRQRRGMGSEDELNQTVEDADPAKGPNGIADTITNMQGIVQAINHDKTLTVHEKRQFTDDLVGNMIALSKAGSKLMKDLKARDR